MTGMALKSIALYSKTGIWKSLAAGPGHQLLVLLLTSIPLAERMLLYHVAMAAWIMLPDRGLLEKTLLASVGRPDLTR